MDDKFLIAEKYAQALFSYAKDNNLIEEVMSDLLLLKEASGLVPDFLRWMSVPIIPLERKVEFVEEIKRAFGLSDAVEYFLRILMEKKRIRFLPDIVERFRILYNTFHHRVDVRVVSARALSESERQLFLHIWGAYLKRWINLVEEVDEDILGGIKVYFRGYLYDASLKKRLELLKEELVR